ncbi:hypothetical protein Tco_0139110 [Tanacetum coccineum]
MPVFTQIRQILSKRDPANLVVFDSSSDILYIDVVDIVLWLVSSMSMRIATSRFFPVDTRFDPFRSYKSPTRDCLISSTNKAFETPEYSHNLESSLDHLHKLLTPPSVILRPNSGFHAWIELEQLEVFNHVIQLIQNPIQRAITEFVHLSLSHHLLLIISVSVDYRPWLADYGVILFEQKVRRIPIRLSDIEFRLITFNPANLLHVF